MRIRKKEPSVGVLGKIVNSFSSSKQDTYSADFINNKIDPLQETVNKIPMKVLSTGTNIDDIKENGKFAVFNATGTLPPGYSTTDNNIFIDCYMWYTSYGRQIFRDVRTNKTFERVLSNGVWQEWSTDVYSTEETFTGKYWRDGKKIYRKIIELSKYQIGKLASINLSNVNIKNVINLDGMVYDNTLEIPINFYNGDDMNYCYYDASTKYLFYNFNWGFYASFILEYTKTTE